MRRLARVRRDLDQATAAYRKAVARHETAQVVALLRTRSRLMRELLETQCEFLLNLRQEAGGPAGTGKAPAYLEAGAIAT
ncbi:MAG: hypothetical protein U1G07_15110 [Verrucomicrobiota bacterium]